jgi:hypothetical protein
MRETMPSMQVLRTCAQHDLQVGVNGPALVVADRASQHERRRARKPAGAGQRAVAGCLSWCRYPLVCRHGHERGSGHVAAGEMLCDCPAAEADHNGHGWCSFFGNLV